jgi:hypothetical protein
MSLKTIRKASEMQSQALGIIDVLVHFLQALKCYHLSPPFIDTYKTFKKHVRDEALEASAT